MVISHTTLFSVPRAGLEPAHREILVFETNASTNSAIGAGDVWNCGCKGMSFFFNVKVFW